MNVDATIYNRGERRNGLFTDTIEGAKKAERTGFDEITISGTDWTTFLLLP